MIIKILHLYYDLMNLYGEYANLKVLEKHLCDQGFEVVIDKKTVGEEILFESYDLVYIGAGTEKNEIVVLDDLIKYKDDIKNYIENKKFIIATGNSFEIFGKKIDEKEGLDIFDFEVVRTKDRITSDVIYNSIYFDEKVVGFVNKMGVVVYNINPLFNVEFGVGANENNDYEGVKYKNFYGTYLLGPMFVRNPYLLKKLVVDICKSKNEKFIYRVKKYRNEEEGYRLVLDELEKRKLG